MSRPPSSNIARSSPLATVRRDQVTLDPLDAFSSPTSAPQHTRPSPKPPVAETAAPFQRVLLPAEILDMETENFLSQCRKHPIMAQSLGQDYDGLVALAQSFFWPAVLKLSGQLLEQESTPDHLLCNITRLRFEALYRMKLYDELANEVTAILQDEEKKIAGDADPQNINYNVVVSMRLLLNDIKLMTGRSEEAVEQLNAMKAWLESVQPATSVVLFWLWQVKCHIVNGYIRLRNWRSASLELNGMLNELQRRHTACTSAEDRTHLLKAQITLLTRLARMLFQIGSVKKATLYYEKASSLVTTDPALARDSAVQTQLLVTQGLLLFSAEQFELALDLFATVIDTESAAAQHAQTQFQSQAGSGDASTITTAFAGMELVATSVSQESAIAAALAQHGLRCETSDGGSLATAVNNLAICALYVKQIRQAITRLEQLILSDPARYLIDPVVFNLCTLYDLSYAPDMSATKKKLMQRVASEYHMDDPILHWRSFRLG